MNTIDSNNIITWHIVNKISCDEDEDDEFEFVSIECSFFFSWICPLNIASTNIGIIHSIMDNNALNTKPISLVTLVTFDKVNRVKTNIPVQTPI